MPRLSHSIVIAAITAAAATAGALLSPPAEFGAASVATRSIDDEGIFVELRSVELGDRSVPASSSDREMATTTVGRLRGRIDFAALAAPPQAPIQLAIFSSGSISRSTAAPLGAFDVVAHPGIVRIRATGPGFLAESHSIRLGAGETVEPIVLAAERAHSIYGTVRRHERSGPVRVSWSKDEYADVADDGTFVIHGLTDGRYPLRLAHRAGDRWMTTSLGAVDAVINEADAVVEMHDFAGSKLTIELWNASRGAIEGIPVSLERQGQTGTAITTSISDRRGIAQFKGLSRSAKSKVTIGIPFVAPAVVSIPVSPIEELDVPHRVTMPLLGAMICLIFDGDGAPAAGVHVSIARGDSTSDAVMTSELGTVTFPHVPIGQYALVIDGHRAAGSAAVTPDQTTRVTAVIRGRDVSTIKGSVRSADGRLLSGARVAVARDDVGVSFAEARTGEDGRFELHVPADGIFSLDAQSRIEGGLYWTRIGGIKAGDDTALTVKPTGRIVAKVEARATAILWSGDLEVDRAADTAGTGIAQFTNVIPGPYRISVDNGSQALDLVVSSDEETRVDLK